MMKEIVFIQAGEMTLKFEASDRGDASGGQAVPVAATAKPCSQPYAPPPSVLLQNEQANSLRQRCPRSTRWGLQSTFGAAEHSATVER